MKKVNLFYQCHFIVVSDISRNNIYLKTENLTTGWHDGWYEDWKLQQKTPKTEVFEDRVSY